MSRGTWLKTRVSMFVTCAIVISGLAPLIAQDASAETAPPTIASDKDDYMPGEHVVLTGSNWLAGETVNIDVNDDQGKTWRRTVDVTADDAGAVRDEFNLPDWFVATYSVVATGQTSGVARTSFTDGNISVRAKAGATFIEVTFPAGSVKKFNFNSTCTAPDQGSNPNPFTTLTNGNYVSGGLGQNNGSASVQAPSPVTIGATTYTFSSWTAEGGATLEGTSGTTGCFTTLSNAALQLTANYSAAPTSVNTTTVAQNKTATFGDSSVSLTATVTPNTVNVGTVTFTVKDGDLATVGSSVTSGTVSAGNASATFPLSGVNAAEYTIQAAYSGGTGFNASNNSGQSPAPTLIVGKANQTITFTSTEPSNAQFDDTYTPTATGGASGNPVTFGASGACSYGSGTVTMTGTGTCTVTANQAGNTNYNAAPQATQTFSVAKKSVTVTPNGGQSKVYGDGDPTLTYTLSESVPVTGALDRTDGEDVGTYAINLGTLETTSANHTLVLSSTPVLFEITKAPTTTTVTCGAGPFTYNGSEHTPCTANVTGPNSLNETLTVNYANNVDAGTATASADYAGTSNYEPSSDSEQFTIDRRSVDVDFTVSNRDYDGTTSASITGCTLTDVVLGEAVSCDFSTATASFADKHAATAKAVTGNGFTLAGADKDNYTIGTVNSATANIDRADLTISAVTDSKTYDGTTSSDETPTVVGLQPGDSVTGLAQAFQSKNVLGAGNSTLVVSSYTVNDGNSGDNYDVTTPTASGTITAAALTISAVTDTKTYDGTTSSDETPTVSGLQGTDTVTNLGQAFQSKSVLGAGNSTLEVTSYTVNDGNSGGNYSINTPTASGTISPAALTITGAVANNKVFDGTKTATVDFTGASLAGVFGTDDVVFDVSGYSAEFNTAAVGSNKPVTVTGVTLSGGDASNYSLTQPSLTASILPWDAEGHGFYAPVGVTNSVFVAAPDSAPKPSSSTIWNTIKGGQTVPLKFEVFAGTVEQTTTAAIAGFTAGKVSCNAVDPDQYDAVDFTTTGGTSLRYDATAGQFIQNWKTPTGTDCYRATVTFADASTLSAFFKLKK